MNNISLLEQSYKDCLEDYNRSIKRDDFPRWDYVILTASNDQQADGFRKQIEDRKGYLPSKTKFVVIPDRDGKRVGSGGATLSVIKYLYEHEGGFDHLRVLVIHSGGDSKRVPQYSALGKLFSPVPRRLPDGRLSTLFDEFIIGMSSIPPRIKDGMFLLSGDVLLLFNPLLIDFNGSDATAVSFKEKAEIGKNHGVFLNGEDNCVKAFLHKQTVEKLTEYGAVNDKNCVDIDTGALYFSCDIINALYSLIDTEEKYDSVVNDTVRLSLYGDFLYPLATSSTLEKFYAEKPEGEFCKELSAAREDVWNALSGFKLKLARLAPAKFIHFGTTAEILRLMTNDIDDYSLLGWKKIVGCGIKHDRVAGYNSVINSKATIGHDCYFEDAQVHRGGKIGNNVILSYIDVHDETIPDNVVVHGIKQTNGKFVVRIFGIDDNPKNNFIFGLDLDVVAKKIDIDLWGDDAHNLWNAKLYPEADDIKTALAASLQMYDSVVNNSGKLDWIRADRKSLCSGFNAADSDALIAWHNRMLELVRMDDIAKAIEINIPAKSISKIENLSKNQKEWLANRIAEADFSDKIRLKYYLGTVLETEEEIQDCFEIIQNSILEATIQKLEFNEKARIVRDKHSVHLPLRVNWGGGWSDTPPYCNEHGGTVLNVAIELKHESPVEVVLERIPELKIVFDSRDMDVHGEFDTIEPLQKTGDPFDPFALQKACLLACGIIPKEGYELKGILERLGGGFVMHSEVVNVPKGSGLGTSSILSAACVKAVFEFMGIAYEEKDLYNHVLAMEQIMSTGGGWQDQVGGITPGLKYITSAPGIDQNIKVSHVEISDETKEELESRFALIYTGQRRLARNLLRDVVGRYIGNEPDSLYALNEIQRVAALMRFELERGKVDEFAKLLEYHWELSKKIDEGSTNTLINQIFASIDDLIDGRLVCGAGGGGFLQVIMKKGVTRELLHNRLKGVFQDSPVDVWESNFVWN